MASLPLEIWSLALQHLPIDRSLRNASMASTLFRTLLTPAFALSHLQAQLHSHRGCLKTFLTSNNLNSADTWTSIPVSYKAALVAHIASLATPPSESILSKWNLSDTLGIRIIQIIFERIQSHPSLFTPLFMQNLFHWPTFLNLQTLAHLLLAFKITAQPAFDFLTDLKHLWDLENPHLPQLHMVDPLISTGNNQIIVMAAKHGHARLFSTLQSHPRVVKRIAELDRVALGVAVANNQTEIISLILDHSSNSSLASKMERVIGVALECGCVWVLWTLLREGRMGAVTFLQLLLRMAVLRVYSAVGPAFLFSFFCYYVVTVKAGG
ncbi:hypothetical protein BJ741DRAFT_595720 [Chytriomyces cf. hyalinus JEL632]|nr:hypothetical protein BJ741DRAFT_595720 [Chytriomyces cf. hyalinus JEL632]